jgi:hypothetical protein
MIADILTFFVDALTALILSIYSLFVTEEKIEEEKIEEEKIEEKSSKFPAKHYLIKTFHKKFWHVTDTNDVIANKPGPIEYGVWTWEAFDFIENDDGTFLIYNPYHKKYLNVQNEFVTAVNDESNAAKFKIIKKHGGHYIISPNNYVLIANDITGDLTEIKEVDADNIEEWRTWERFTFIEYEHDVVPTQPDAQEDFSNYSFL